MSSRTPSLNGVFYMRKNRGLKSLAGIDINVGFFSQTFHVGQRSVKPSVRKQVSSPSPQRAFFCPA